MKKKRRRRKNKAKPQTNGAAPKFTIELVSEVNEEIFVEVFALTLLLHEEAGILPLDREKAAESVYKTLSQGMSLIARSDEGKVIGTLGIIEQPIYYSTETMLWDKWIFVLPEWRNGDVGKSLLTAAKDVAEAKEKILVIQINNPKRRRKPPLKMSLAAQQVGYIPKSYSIRMR